MCNKVVVKDLTTTYVCLNTVVRKGKERKSIYIAPFRTKVLTKRSGMDHTVLPANNTMPGVNIWHHFARSDLYGLVFLCYPVGMLEPVAQSCDVYGSHPTKVRCSCVAFVGSILLLGFPGLKQHFVQAKLTSH